LQTYISLFQSFDNFKSFYSKKLFNFANKINRIMKFKILVFLFVTILFFSSCQKNRTNEKNKPTQEVSLLVPTYMESPIKEWVYFVQANHPNFKFQIVSMNDDNFHSDTTFRDFDLIFTAENIKDNKYNYVNIASEAIVCVVSFDNPFLQSIINRGISPDDLKKIFNKPNFYYWKDFFQTDSKMNEKISIVLPSDRYALLTQLKKWLQIDTLLINTQTTDTILNILKNQKNLLTFLPSSVVYNLDTKYRKDFLYIIPLDLNNDNWISDDEYLYDNIMILGQAVLNKKIDTSLILNYKMIYSIDNPLKDSLINLLNNKQNINKNIFEKFGYFAY